MNINNFIKAAKSGNLQFIQKYISDGFDINTQDEYGFTALLESAEMGHKELFWWLIEHGANIHIKATHDFSLIHAVALGGDLKMLNYLLSNGFDINNHVSSGEQIDFTVHDYAILSNNKDILDFLKSQ